ncbi:type II toxin-antitoxin system VapC family toxin [Caballeronia sp. HLA56]
MRLLLDTHIYVWSVTEDRRLPKKARSLIEDATEIYVSSASIWELAIKAARGKLELRVQQILNGVDDLAYAELTVSHMHALAVRDLPLFHYDPFDRLLVAQAASELLRLITSDRLLSPYHDYVTVV